MSAAMMVPMPTDQLRSMATYVKETQPVLEKAGKFETALSQRISSVVDVLVQHGCLHPQLKEAKARELTAEPSKLLDEIVKLASQVQVAPVGGPAGREKGASANVAVENGPSSSQVFLQTLTGGG